MTSATAPYGSVFYGGDTDLSNGSAYKAFDGNDTKKASVNTWQYTTKAPCWIGYEFLTSVVAKEAVIYIGNPAAVSAWVSDSTSVIQGSTDNATWNDLCSAQTSSDYATKKIISINPNAASYKYYRCYFNKQPHSYQGKYDIDSFITLQIYGENYSEYDWDADNPRHYLYDHGVELETITTSGTVTKGNAAITLQASNAQAITSINTSAYNLMRGEVGEHASGTNQLICGSGSANFLAANMPYNQSLDISSISGANSTGVKQTSTGVFDAAAWWIE
jgi:hypothetical protein